MAEWNELIIISLAVVFALALPLVTLWRLRTPGRRRDEWLGANAQPRFARMSFAIGLALTLVGALASALIAMAGYRLAWAIVALSLGLLATTIISAVAAFTAPRDLE